jgi:hypothetical protein
MAHMGCDPVGDHAKESGDAQIGDDDHHAQQQRDRIEVDRVISLLGAQHAGADHQARAEQRRAGAIDAVNWNLADRDEGIGRAEDEHRKDQGQPGHDDGFPQSPAPRHAPVTRLG